MRDDFKKARAEVLSKLDIRAECEKLGIIFQGRINRKGWIPCLNPYKKESNPSCGVQVNSGPSRGYLVAFNMNNSVKPHWAVSLFDLARDFGDIGTEFHDILKHYADKAGVELPDEKKSPAPTSEQIEEYTKALPESSREYLHQERGLTDESIEKYEIGYCKKRLRISFPVYDKKDELVNIRFYGKDKKPKMLNLRGYGQARLWGTERLQEADDGKVVCLTEGEFDSMLIEQETGLLSVSPTNGANAFLKEWVGLFHGCHVAVVWDCDEEGRKAVKNLILPSFKAAVTSGKVLSIKVMWLFDNANDKSQKDGTDWFVKCGGTGEKLREIINNTETYDYPAISSKSVTKPIPLDSFLDIEKPEYAGKRVTVPLYVYGENSETYHTPTEVEVSHCQMLDSGKCKGRAEVAYTCEETIKISMGERIQLAAIHVNDSQLLGMLREYICDKNKKPALRVDQTNKLTLREVYAHQVTEGDPVGITELSEKAIYIVGSDQLPIGRYKATGYVYTYPRNQKPTILVDTIEPEEEDWQSFDIESARDLLRPMKKASIEDLLIDISNNVTRIYDRDEIHLGVMLSLCSPRYFDFPGDGQIRGWVSAIVVGDTRTGKTSVSEGLFNYMGIGYRVSGMTSSRTGITYACDYDERRGWRIKAGALLKMSRQALIIDECQDLREFELKTMAEAMDSGRLKIDRIQNRTFEAETRCFFSCNPRAKDRTANQRTMDSFRYGCQSIRDIFPQMMVRRVDLVLFASSHDIKDKNLIYNPKSFSKEARIVTPDRLRALVYFAWNLRPDQINLTSA